MSLYLAERDNVKFLSKQKKLEEIVVKHNDIVGSIACDLIEKYSLNSHQKNLDALKKLEDDHRLLRIGIVGRVKAGKSTLINALFFNGKSVLPKAATPMTAALTVLSYGDKLSAEADFFSEDDIRDIKQNHDKYISELDIRYKKIQEELTGYKEKEVKEKRAEFRISYKLTEEEIEEVNSEAKAKALGEMKEQIALTAAYDQYNIIQRSKIANVSSLKSKILIPSDTLSSLSEELLDYVGADGKYMPFTKSATLTVPDESLKDIEIIDTPGINDPVQSREARTRELLKNCDVVLVVTPGAQFMNTSDTELMDRVTMREGIRDIYIVASQVDTELIGSIGRDCDWNLHKALSSISNKLSNKMHETLIQLKMDSPEVGDCYDQLIDGSNSTVLLTSAIAKTILGYVKRNKKEWNDDGAKVVWHNLKRAYSNYFTDTDIKSSNSNLEKLANISGVRDIIGSIRDKKTTILANRRDDYIKSKMNSLNDYHKELKTFIDVKIENISNGDAAELQKQRRGLKKVKKVASIFLDEVYFLEISSLVIELEKTLLELLKEFMSSDMSSEVVTETVEEVTRKKSGCKSKRTKIVQQRKLRTGGLVRILAIEASRVEDSISHESKRIIIDWRTRIPGILIGEIRSRIDDEDLQEHIIIQAIGHVLDKIIKPSISYSGELPRELSGRGTIVGKQVDLYLDNLHRYKTKFQRRIRRDIQLFLEELNNSLSSIALSEEFFSNYDEKLKELEEQIENKEIVIDSFNRLRKDIAAVK